MKSPHTLTKQLHHILQYRAYIVFAIQCVFSVTILTLLLIPFIQQLQFFNAELSTDREQELRQQQVALQEQEQEQLFNQLDKKSIVSSSILPENDVITFVEYIEEAAQQAGVTQHISLERENSTKKNGMVVIPMNMYLSGSWNALIDSIGRIEELDIYIQPQNLSIRNTGGDENEREILIEALTYWQPHL